MAFADCIRSAAEQGALSPDEAEELIRRYDAHVAANKGTAHPGGAEAAAKEALAKEVSDEAARKTRLAELSAAKADEIMSFLEGYRRPGNEAGPGERDVVAGILGLLDNRNDTLAGVPSVTGRRDALVGLAHARLEAGLYAHRRSFGLGKRLDPARLDRVVDEAFGTGTGDAAAANWLATWREVADDLVDRFNAAGGDIGKREAYFPQRHDARKIAAAGERAWTDFIRPRLDLASMRDPLTGGPLSPARLDEALSVIYRRIVTDGAIDLKPSGQARGRGALANQRQEERFLDFKDAGAWRDYAEAFGSTDVFAVMMDHVHGLAKDVAALEILGPNPKATVEWLKQVVEQEAAKAKLGEASLYTGPLEGTAAGRIAAPLHRIDNLWSVVNGGSGVANMTAANVMESARNVVMGANLAGTALTAFLGDPFQQTWARRFAGIPAFRWFAELPAQILSGASKREVVRAGLVMEDALDHLTTDLRDLSWSAKSREASRWLPDRVFAWTGLTPWTRAHRRAQGMSFMFEAGDRAGQSLAEMAADGVRGERFARFLEGFGIGEAEWDLIRASKGFDHGEAGALLRVVDVVDAHPGDEAAFEAAMRYSEAVHAFVEEAVPQGTARARAKLERMAPKGSFAGEAVRASTSYLAYPMTMMTSLIRATALETAAGGLGRGGGFLAAAVAGLTLGGALITQMRALRAGHDPEPVDSAGFWLRAFAAGGALGFWGDWLMADYERGAGQQVARLAGPVVGSAVDLYAAIGGAQSLTADHDVGRAARLVGWAKRNTPVANMWWLRPASEHLVWNRLQRLVDPKADASWQRKANELWRRQRQGVWWRPGDTLPERAPALSLTR